VRLIIIGNGNGLQVQLDVEWGSLKAFIKAALATLGTTTALLSVPEIMRLLGH
jgi:hypothetical protein